MTGTVFVAGALHYDIVVQAPRFPWVDETLKGSSVAYRLGGKGGNQAVAAARFGAAVSMAGRVGSDFMAEKLLETLDSAGVGRNQVRRCSGPTGMSVAVVDGAGSYRAVTVSGANQDLRADEISVPADTAVAVLQCEVPQSVNLSVVSMLPKDSRLILNSAPACAVDPAILSRTDILVANRVEASGLTGSAAEEFEPARAAETLIQSGPGAVVITLGAGGLFALESGGRSVRLPAHSVDVTSTHGAGDAFVGALAAELTRGADFWTSLDFAQAAAALEVSAPPDRRKDISEADVRNLASDHAKE